MVGLHKNIPTAGLHEWVRFLVADMKGTHGLPRDLSVSSSVQRDSKAAWQTEIVEVLFIHIPFFLGS